MLNKVVYFSSATNNTHRFVQKLGLESIRIPMRVKDEQPIVNHPYVLIVPTYGGGASIMGRESKPIPVQVDKFLSIEENAKNMKAVIAGGNSNFGSDYCKAGDLISSRYGVPYVYRFELMGNSDDVKIVLEGLSEFEFD